MWEGGHSNHFPILLEVKGDYKKPGTPFKFNSSWLNDESFIALFHDTWRKDCFREDESRIRLFMDNLKRMKLATKEWDFQMKLKEEEVLKNVNLELDFLESPEGNGYATLDSRDRVNELESIWRIILQLREESWRLKSCTIWL